MKTYILFLMALFGVFVSNAAMNNDNADLFNNPREYKGMDSNYFPVKVNNHLYMCQSEEIDGLIANEYGLHNYGKRDSLINIHRELDVPFYCNKMHPLEYGLKIVLENDSIKNIFKKDLNYGLSEFFDESGFIKGNIARNSEGYLLYVLYVNRIAVKTDCMSGSIFVPYIDSVVKSNQSAIIPNFEKRDISERVYLTVNICGKEYIGESMAVYKLIEKEYNLKDATDAQLFYYEKFDMNTNFGCHINPNDYGLYEVIYDKLIEAKFENEDYSAKTFYKEKLKDPAFRKQMEEQRKLGYILYKIYSDYYILDFYQTN